MRSVRLGNRKSFYNLHYNKIYLDFVIVYKDSCICFIVNTLLYLLSHIHTLINMYNKKLCTFTPKYIPALMLTLCVDVIPHIHVCLFIMWICVNVHYALTQFQSYLTHWG